MSQLFGYQLHDLATKLESYTFSDLIYDRTPTFVDLVNGELNSVLRTRYNTKLARLQLSTQHGQTRLPEDYLAFKSVKIDDVDAEYVTPEQFDHSELVTESKYTFTIVGDWIKVKPTPSNIVKTENVNFLYSLSGVLNPKDETSYDVYIYWTPDDINPAAQQTGTMRVTRTNRTTQVTNVTDYNITQGSPFILNLDTTSLQNYTYDFVLYQVDDRSNKIRLDYLKDEKFEEFETNSQIDVIAPPVLEVSYYHTLPDLSTFDTDGISETDRNNLYEKFPNIYLYGALGFAFAFLMDEEKSILYGEKFKQTINQITVSDRMDSTYGSVLVMRSM